jgi:hypothetical protein
VINYFDNGSEFASVGAASEKNDSTNFNEFPPCGFDVDFGHSAGSIVERQPLRLELTVRTVCTHKYRIYGLVLLFWRIKVEFNLRLVESKSTQKVS